MSYRSMWMIKNWRNHSAASLSSAKNTNSGIWQAQRTIIRSILLVFIASGLYAQTQGAKPYIYDANTGGLSSNISCVHAGAPSCIDAPDDVAAGDIAFVAVSCDQGPTPPGATPPFPITDHLANTWNTQTAALSLNAGRGAQAIQTSYSQIANAGTDWFIVNGSGGLGCGGDGVASYAYARFKNLNGTLDGGPVNGLSSHIAGTNVDIISTSHVVTHNGEVAVGGVTDVANAGVILSVYGSNTQFASSDAPNNAGGNLIIYFSVCGAVGTTCTQNTVAYSSNAAAVMQTLYFIPDMAISDTKLPDCALGSPCKFTIHGVGGIAALTCSITAGSLPTGMSAGGTGNCTFSGTPSSLLSAGNITFKIDDGTSNVSKTLPFTVAGSFKPLTVVQSKNLGNATSVTFDSPATCGNMILVCGESGMDTHGGAGWVFPVDGVNNFVSDTLNSARYRIPVIPGIRTGPNSCAALGPLTSTGTETVNLITNQSAASALAWTASEIQAQSLAEEGTFGHADPTIATTSNSVSFVAPVDNMYDYLVSSALGGSATITLSGAFTSRYSNTATYNYFNFGDLSGLSAGSVTGTINYASGAPDAANMVIGLRPRIPSAPCGEVVPPKRHKAQVY